MLSLGVVASEGDIVLIESTNVDYACAVVARGSKIHDTVATAAAWLDSGLASGGGAAAGRRNSPGDIRSGRRNEVAAGAAL